MAQKAAGKAAGKTADRAGAKKNGVKKAPPKKASGKKLSQDQAHRAPLTPPAESNVAVLDRLFATVMSRRTANPAHSHSARLLSRGPTKVAQKFGEEAVECLIEAVAGTPEALVAESADVLYHLVVMWVAAGIEPTQVWDELTRREGISGIAEKAARARPLLGTTKIP